MLLESALLAVVLAALLFAFTNGLHDSAHTIVTAIVSRALTPGVAIALATLMTLLGAFLGEGVARTIGQDFISPIHGADGLAVLFAALSSAAAWNLFSWYRGMPSSASHALIGGMVGAALASQGEVRWDGVLISFLVPMLVAPLLGWLLGYLIMLGILWLFRDTSPGVVNRGFRLAQSVSAAMLSLGNGLQDAQKTMGIVVLALITVGSQNTYEVPTWVTLCSAVAISLGTATGGWRIMRTLGWRMSRIDPPQGFAVEAAVSAIMGFTSLVWHAPISSTHTTTSAIAGAGTARRVTGVRWGIFATIVLFWLITVPVTAVIAAGVYGLLHTVV